MAWGLYALVDVGLGSTGAPMDAWVRDADVDARGGLGAVQFTTNPVEAKRFDDPAAALEYWRRPSRVLPTRPDGRPNRPLTAFTCEIRRIPE